MTSLSFIIRKLLPLITDKSFKKCFDIIADGHLRGQNSLLHENI